MIHATAKTKYVRISPRKARLAAGLIRGKQVRDALSQLTYCNLKAGRLLRKTLLTAIANAENEFDVTREELVVDEVLVDQGPTMKRAKPKNRGGKHPIL